MQRDLRRLAVVFLLAFAGAAIAQEATPPADSPLDELLTTPISTAAKYEQNMGDVAASVTVISAEEIARYGWQTLADVLASVRGVYTTTDRAYTYLGVRGIGLPTDYNNRFLLLIDGIAMTEVVSGSIDIGTALAIDMSHIERIEFVRGPSSVLYGTGAMYGVINLITKDERERTTVTASIGSDELRRATARAGAQFGPVSAAVALSWQESNGPSHYFPEYDAPATHNGIVRGRDYDDHSSLIATARWGGLRLVTLHSLREKGVPTGSWGTTFGDDQRISDGRSLWAASWSQQLRPTLQLTARAVYDHSDYTGVYPLDGAYDYSDRSHSIRRAISVESVWDVRANHRVTSGFSWADNDGVYSWTDGSGEEPAIGGHLGVTGAYVQTESQFTPRLALTAGLAWERRETTDAQITPRLALVYRPDATASVKLLFGRGFREPTFYELDYEAEGFLSSDVMAERIRTIEIAAEKRINDSILVSGSLFDVHVDDLISLEPVGDAVQFQNVGAVESHGAELQLDYRRADGLWSYVSYTYQCAVQRDSRMLNSPLSLVKGGISTSTSARMFGGAEARFETGRHTFANETTDAAIIANFNAGIRLSRNLLVTLTVQNAFDEDFYNPAGPEHLQDTLAINGRSFLLTFRAGGR
jgi:outer membrane receptor protein involved in Fe transport